MPPARHTNRLWLAANAFGATLRRDLVVTRRELPQFLVQALIQPMFFLLIFCKILPSIGLTSGNFAALLLPGIVGLTEFDGGHSRHHAAARAGSGLRARD